ncbi:MAG: SPOR domain-containing protein, partial [Rikenellaceae bacterium]
MMKKIFNPLCVVSVALIFCAISLCSARGTGVETVDSVDSVEDGDSVEELANDSLYVTLLAQNVHLIAQRDSLLLVVSECREALEHSEDGSRERLVSSELELIDLQVMINGVQGQISQIAEKWELRQLDLSRDNNSSRSESRGRSDVELGGESIATIYNSRVVRAKLSEDDLTTLIEADEDEAEVSKLYSAYLECYHQLRNLQQLYNQTNSESEAAKHIADFKRLEVEAAKLMRGLDLSWGDLYDDKIFVYTLLLEHLELGDQLTRGEEILRDGAAKVALLEEGASRIVGGYEYRKRALLGYEQIVAEALELTVARDSLRNAVKSVRVSSVGGEELTAVEIVERNFIDYDDIKFSSSAVYKASNPIPMAKSYEKGTIYRIQVGAFQSKQQPTIFRGAYPVSYDKAFGFWTYYIGGYPTLAEAQKGQALCKARGFKRPEVVRWSDGKRRNLDREP